MRVVSLDDQFREGQQGRPEPVLSAEQWASVDFEPLNVLSLEQQAAMASASHPLNETPDGQPLNVLGLQKLGGLLSVPLGDQSDSKREPVHRLGDVTERGAGLAGASSPVGDVSGILGQGGGIDALVRDGLAHNDSPLLGDSDTPSVGVNRSEAVPPASPTGTSGDDSWPGPFDDSEVAWVLRDQHVAVFVDWLASAATFEWAGTFAADGLGYLGLAAAAGQEARLSAWALALGRAKDAAWKRLCAASSQGEARS